MKVIQVGIGGMGNTWLQTVEQSSEVEFAGFVEINQEIADQQAQAYDLDPTTIYTSLDDALAVLEADAILNVTPPQFHLDISRIALEAGLPVLSEKPLAGTLADAREIVKIAEQTSLPYMVAQNYRYSALAQMVKSLLESAELGTVSAVHVHFAKGPHFGGFREAMDHPLIIDMAIHHFDLLRFFIGSNPQQIMARSWNPAWSWYRGDASATVHTTFQNGVEASYNGTWCSQGMETTWNGNWRFECERGILNVRDDTVYIQESTGVEDRGGLRHVRNAPERAVDLVPMPYQQQAYLLHEFYEAVVNGHTPQTSAQDNLHTVQYVFDIVHACAINQVVPLGSAS